MARKSKRSAAKGDILNEDPETYVDGRTKDCPKLRRVILDALAECMPFNYACDLAGIDRETGYRWMRKDKAFAAQVAIAKATAIKGLVDLTAKQSGAWKLLKNLGRDEFQERVEVEQTSNHRIIVDAGSHGTKQFPV